MKFQPNDKILGTSYDMCVLNQELYEAVGGIIARFEPNTYMYSVKVYVTKAATGNNDAIELKNRDGSVTYGTFDGTAVGTTVITMPSKLQKDPELTVNLDMVDGAVTFNGDGGFDGEARIEFLFSHESGGGEVTGNPKADDSTVFTPTPA